MSRLDRASEVELPFVDEAPGRTRVELSHHHLDRHGEEAAGIRAGVSGDGGWPMIMQRYIGAVDGRE